MSVKPRDHRPKVISFRTALDGLNIAARQSVLWPCHAFNISIPQKKKSGLNVFEETVLKITEIESGDTEKLRCSLVWKRNWWPSFRIVSTNSAF